MSNEDMSTKPTIETVLERMNAWGEQFRSEFAELRSGQIELRGTVEELRKGQDELRKGQDELRKGQDELWKGQEELRADLHANLHLIARKIQALNDNILTIQANMRDLVVYIERLESGSLAPK
jgi:uncharacterized coiled-coil DUF342 family protein